MKNMVLYATLIECISKMDDVQISTMLGHASNILGAKGKSKAKTKDSKEYKATDVTIKMTAVKNAVTLDEFVKKDAWEVLKRRFESVGGTYDKASKSITFKTAKDAKAFASNNIVKADERKAIWAEWAK